MSHCTVKVKDQHCLVETAAGHSAGCLRNLYKSSIPSDYRHKCQYGLWNNVKSHTLAQNSNSAVTAAVYSLIRYDVFEKLETKINKHPLSLKCNVSKHIWLRMLIPFFSCMLFFPLLIWRESKSITNWERQMTSHTARVREKEKPIWGTFEGILTCIVSMVCQHHK